MKKCKGCPTPAKCKAAGKCMKSGYDEGGVASSKTSRGFSLSTDALMKKLANGTLTLEEFQRLAELSPDAATKYYNGMANKAKHKASGSKTKSAGYNKGGYAKCGASNPPAKKR